MARNGELYDEAKWGHTGYETAVSETSDGDTADTLAEQPYRLDVDAFSRSVRLDESVSVENLDSTDIERLEAYARHLEAQLIEKRCQLASEEG